jgi:hypothetical protein
MTDTPRFLTPKTAYRFQDFWVGSETTYREVNPEGGYFSEAIHTAYVGTPEDQGFVDVYASNHPVALKWCKDVFRKRKESLLEELNAVEDKLRGYNGD